MNRGIDLAVTYPHYRLDTESSYFFFDHGHLFSSALDKLTNASEAVSLEDLEEKTFRFMEKVWYETKSRARERIYDFFRKIKLRMKRAWRIRDSRRTTFDEDATPVYDDYLRSQIIWYLQDICKIKEEVKKDFHFIIGHTHHGGRVLRVDRKIRINGRFITVWNTGGWLVPSKVFSPDAYIFYIEQTAKGLEPNAYKLVAKGHPEDEGDYSRSILQERVKHTG
jgi:hypothetical protein